MLDKNTLNSIFVANEINLNSIAQHFGVKKKFKWEDILLLNESHLKGILCLSTGKRLYLFYFGSIVFVNMEFHEILDCITYLKGIDKSINTDVSPDLMETYQVDLVDTRKDIMVNNSKIEIPTLNEYYFNTVSMIIAKSVALDKLEIEIDKVFDKMEDIFSWLKVGKLSIKDKSLSKLLAKILMFKFNTISSVMILDKPDFIWNNLEAEKVYQELAILFELEDRYNNLKHKSETLLNITTTFTNLVQSRRSSRLEWIIIILIAVEIVLSIFKDFIQ